MRIATIIPAFNEQASIRRIIHLLQRCDFISEIIVVNDASTDHTAEIVAEEYGVILVNLSENLGKGGALKAGLDATRADVLVLLDADLIGLRVEHVEALLAPVLQGKADATVGVFKEGRGVTDLAQLVAPQLSGQRAIKRELIETADIANTRYGVEVAINRHLEDMKARVEEVELFQLTHQTKEEKLGFVKGMGARFRMYYEVAKILVGRE